MAILQDVGLTILDWAGTVVDYGCIAPLIAFQECFRQKDISLRLEAIAKPMGMEKKEHIRELLRGEGTAAQWRAQHKRDWDDRDVEALYQLFEEKLYSIVEEYSQVMDGVLDAVRELRDMGVVIGSTTGYTPEMMDVVAREALRSGYEPDFLITPQHVGSGRPRPFMIYENMKLADVYPACRVVKAGDTVADILEAKNAGVWAVGILEGSSIAGLSPEDAQTMTQEEIRRRHEAARCLYEEAGADYVIRGIAELPEIVRKINLRLKETAAV